MSIEIERKFLLLDDSWRAAVEHSTDLDQGYLVGTGGKSSVRVRVGGQRAALNIKAAVVGASRAEYEYEIPMAEALEILKTLSHGRVCKTRHFIPQGELVWEIDEFQADNQGLVVAEIELPSEDAVFHRPSWLGAEVTEDARFYNHSLAMDPWSQWGTDFLAEGRS